MITMIREVIIYKVIRHIFCIFARKYAIAFAVFAQEEEAFMKRFLCIILSAALLMCPLSGCGKKDGGSANASQASDALTEDENDTMHLNMLFSLIGTPDTGVTELLGDGEKQKYNADGSLKQRMFSGIVYRTEITFTVFYDEFGDVSSIDVDFPASLSQDQLSATVTNLIGRQPAEDGTWQAETAVISLVHKDDHMCMTLVPYAATTE